MNRIPRLAFLILLAGLAAPAAAQNSPAVDSAVRTAAVGERFDGFLGFASGVSDSVRRHVGAINIRRRSLYTDLAARRRVTVQEVGIAAGCELLAQVKPAEAYMLSDGVWRRRIAGQPAPVPDYCGR